MFKTKNEKMIRFRYKIVKQLKGEMHEWQGGGVVMWKIC